MDSLLVEMLERNVNMKDYFESNLPMTQIEHDSFTRLHSDKSSLIMSLDIPRC